MGIGKFRQILKGKDCDFSLFYTPDSARANPNITYLSGYSGIGVLIVPRSQAPFLVVPSMEFERAKKSQIKKVFGTDKKKLFESAYKLARNRLKIGKIAIDGNNFTLNSYRHLKSKFKKAKIRDLSSSCLELRAVKTDKEVRLIRKSCSHADRIIQKTIKNIRDFDTESSISAFLEYEAKRNGLEIPFNPIVASGSNGSMPHHTPSAAKIKKGFCVIDFGVKYKGYCSDITRTIHLGKASKKEKDIYAFLLKAQKNTIEEIKINDLCSKIYEGCTHALKGYSKYFIHGLGHGIGVEVHELPNLTLDSKDKIVNNMVFTIEPGIYFPKKFGIRIEDTVLFRNKPIVLTKTAKDILIV